MTDTEAEFDDLLEKSSLGSRGARRLRTRTSPARSRAVREFADARNRLAHSSDPAVSWRAAVDMLLKLHDLGHSSRVEEVLLTELKEWTVPLTLRLADAVGVLLADELDWMQERPCVVDKFFSTKTSPMSHIKFTHPDVDHLWGLSEAMATMKVTAPDDGVDFCIDSASSSALWAQCKTVDRPAAAKARGDRPQWILLIVLYSQNAIKDVAGCLGGWMMHHPDQRFTVQIKRGSLDAELHLNGSAEPLARFASSWPGFVSTASRHYKTEPKED